MRTMTAACFLLGFSLFTSSRVIAQDLFPIPLRINMGGPELVDSNGNTWLGDPGADADVLGIRPDDAGGKNAIIDWSRAVIDGTSLADRGFDATNANDASLLSTIRWDPAAEAPDWLMEIPIRNGTYTVNFYFLEAGAGRHYKIQLQGVIVEPDQSSDPGILVRRTFPGVLVEDEVLRIGLLPCAAPECPDSVDPNPILNALEILSGPACGHQVVNFNTSFDPETVSVTATWATVEGADGYQLLRNGVDIGGDDSGIFVDTDPTAAGTDLTYTLRVLAGEVVITECSSSLTATACARGLVCDVDLQSGIVDLSWEPPVGIDLISYEVARDGEVIANLDANQTSLTDAPDNRLSTYTVTPITDPVDACPPLTCQAGLIFDMPLRINNGGEDFVDSRGRLWQGDAVGGAADTLAIRPDDGGGSNLLPSWCAVDGSALESLGLAAVDAPLLAAVRWDTGTDTIDYRFELPVENFDQYLVNLYFHECCCDFRHFKVEMQGAIVAPDVYSGIYEKPTVPATGRVSIPDVVVTDNILSIALLPCPVEDCPDATDGNAVLSAIEIVKGPCSDPTFGLCPTNLNCELVDQDASLTWNAPFCRTVEGYEIWRDGSKLEDLPATATSYIDPLNARAAIYSLVTKVAEGEASCTALSCQIVDPSVPFGVPSRINMGGRALIDSRDRPWIGDGPGGGDPLDIRPDDAGGSNTAVNWSSALSGSIPWSLQSLGLDPFNPNDLEIFNTIRWDGGAAPPDFQMEIPIVDGDYLINFYFTEQCCLDRHFSLVVQDEVVDADVSNADYSATGAPGVTGRLSFDDISVTDGILKIDVLPCPDPDCPGSGNTDAIVDAIEILPAGSDNPVCPRDLICTVNADDSVSLNWTAGSGVSVTGFEIYRAGELLETMDGDATSYEDDSGCVRAVRYEVVPISDDDDFLCPGMRLFCDAVNLNCAFASPVRLNMGGPTAEDSQGRRWFGDGVASNEAADPWELRPVDTGGGRSIADFVGGNLKPESYVNLGLDPTHAGDRAIFNSIRWDPADAFPYELEVPVGQGEYTVNLYFNEGCCPQRHAKVSIEGELVAGDVSAWDFDPNANRAALPPVPAEPGHLGMLSFEGVAVFDGVVSIELVGCAECFEPVAAAVDVNPILNALEIIRTGDVCPDEGDTFCDGLVVAGPEFNAPGTYVATATARDTSGDTELLYVFTADNGVDDPTVVGPQAENTAELALATGEWTVSVVIDDHPLCNDVAEGNSCSETVSVCPGEGDTHCDGLSISPPDSPDGTGTGSLTASATDDSGDAILYTFTVDDGVDPAVVIGPQAENTAEFEFSLGTYTISVAVDDDPDCADVAIDATCEEVIVITSPQASFKRGDSNHDGVLDISDPLANLGFQFAGTFTPTCKDALDYNDDGILDISDPIGSLSFQFAGTGEPPKLPGKDTCGPDPTPDAEGEDLGCESYTRCGNEN